VAIAAAFALALWESRGQALHGEQLAFLARYHAGGVESLLRPLDGNLVVLGVLVHKASFGLCGVGAYLPLRIAAAAAAATCGGLFFLFARRGAGEWLALAGAVVLLFLGSASATLATPAGLAALISIALGLGSMLCLRRETTGFDLAAGGLLACSLAAYGFGLAFAAAAVVQLCLARSWRRAAAVLWPLVLYAGWRIWAIHFHDSALALHNLEDLPNSIFTSFAAACAAITGLFRVPGEQGASFTLDWGWPLAVLLGGLLLLRARRPLPPAFWIPFAALLAFWALAGLGYFGGGEPEASRYLYLSALLLLLTAAEVLPDWRPSVWGVVGVLAALAISLLGNLANYNEAARQLRSEAQPVPAQLAAGEIGRADAPETGRSR
jgi:hypothetical protein